MLTGSACMGDWVQCAQFLSLVPASSVKMSLLTRPGSGSWLQERSSTIEAQDLGQGICNCYFCLGGEAAMK